MARVAGVGCETVWRHPSGFVSLNNTVSWSDWSELFDGSRNRRTSVSVRSVRSVPVKIGRNHLGSRLECSADLPIRYIKYSVLHGLTQTPINPLDRQAASGYNCVTLNIRAQPQRIERVFAPTEQLRRLIERLAFQANRVAKSPGPDAVHDLRVAVRRLDQAITTYNVHLPRKPAKRIRKQLKTVLSAAGAVRD